MGPGTASEKQSTETEKDRGTEKALRSNASSSETTATLAGKQRASGGKCTLDANLIPKALDQAEKSRDQGNYAAAERQFRSVLACEPENARARGGLERVLFAKQTER
jgi:Flp pilus assembly protein TadD